MSNPLNKKFVVVLGLNSSGSSCIAGVLHALGVNFGNNLQGRYGNEPDTPGKCGFEDRTLVEICESTITFPRRYAKLMPREVKNLFEEFVDGIVSNPENKDSRLLGLKYPSLCLMTYELATALAAYPVLWVTSDRISSVCAESWAVKHNMESGQGIPLHVFRAWQDWLFISREDFLLRCVAKENLLRVDFEKLVERPAKVIGEIASKLGVGLDAPKLDRAISFVRPDMKKFSHSKRLEEEVV